MALSKKDKKEIYEYLKKNIKMHEIKSMYPNIYSKDLEMCIATKIYDVCDNFKIDLVDAVCGIKDMEELGKSALVDVKKEILDSFGYYKRRETEYNYKFRKNRKQFEHESNYYDNPFFLSEKRFNKQFEDFTEDTEEQIYAKTIFWVNNVTKPLEFIKENVIKNINIRNDTIGAGAIMSILDKESKLKIIEEKYNLRDEFVVLYKRYLEDDVTKEELESDEVYMNMQSLLLQKNEGLDISMKDVYKFFSLNSSIRSLYMVKDAFVEKLLSKYKKLEENKTQNDCLRIYQQENNDKDCKLEGKAKKDILTIVVKGTNIPFRVHIPSEHLKEIQDCYEIEIPKGGFDKDDRAVALITYDKNQQKKIEVLNEERVSAYFDFGVRQYVKQQYDMCNNIDNVNIDLDSKEQFVVSLEENSSFDYDDVGEDDGIR